MGYSLNFGQKGDIWGTQKIWAKKKIFGVLKKFGPKKQLCGSFNMAGFIVTLSLSKFKLFSTRKYEL